MPDRRAEYFDRPRQAQAWLLWIALKSRLLPPQPAGMCRQRRIARFGSLYEAWRTVLFELVFAPCYSVASTCIVRPYHVSP
jgi:hypothetical protein